MVKVDKLMVNGDKLMVKVDREAGRPGAVFEAEFLVDAATAGHAHAHHHLGSGASRAGYSHLSLLRLTPIREGKIRHAYRVLHCTQ